MKRTHQSNQLMLAACLALCLCASVVQSQPLLPSLASAPVKQTFLTWDSTAPRFNVYRGASRSSLTNWVTLTTNSFPIQDGVTYGVTALGGGTESIIAYWPSNRIGQIRLREQGKTNVTTLERFTNSPPEAVRFWRVENVTVGWQ